MRYWLGPWIGSGTAEDPQRPPDGVIQTLKLKPAPNRWGLMITTDAVRLGEDYRLIAQGDVDAVPPAKTRSVYASAVGVPNVSGDTIADWLRDTLTIRAQPDGDGGPAPLAPTRRLQCEMHIGRPVRWRFRPDENPALVEQLRRQYRRARQAARDGQLKDEVHHLRVLDAWREKYRTEDDRLFVPADLPLEPRVRHETTIGDTFTDTDSTALSSHTATGANGGHSWSYLHSGSSWDIQSNQVNQTGNFGLARADSDLSTDDHYAQIVVPVPPSTTTQSIGVAARKDSSSTLSYYLAVCRSTQWQTYEWDGGSFGQLGSTTSQATATNDVIRIEAEGSTIRRLRNGSEQASLTDGTTSGNYRCGIACIHSLTGPRGDDWEAGDLGAAPAVTIPIYRHHFESMARR